MVECGPRCDIFKYFKNIEFKEIIKIKNNHFWVGQFRMFEMKNINQLKNPLYKGFSRFQNNKYFIKFIFFLQ